MLSAKHSSDSSPILNPTRLVTRESSEAIALACKAVNYMFQVMILRVQTPEQFGLPLRKKAKSSISIIHWKQLHLYISIDCKRKKN